MIVDMDISQLVLDPCRSGIQRAERELIRHWPGPGRLRPCRFEPSTRQLHRLPDSILGVLCEDIPPGGLAAEKARLAPHDRLGPVVHPTRLLNVELFPDARRARFYRQRPPDCRAFWLVYDFLPWLSPQWFSYGLGADLMPFLQALLTIPDLAFISAKTRDDFVGRVLRRPCAGPVIAMGADGLALERQVYNGGRHSFVMLGTIEPRKNVGAVIQAFQALWREGLPAQLTMIGAVADGADAERALVESLGSQPLFRHLTNLSDTGVREVLRRARAVLFPSEGEGFGIPPIEALQAGIPVIVSSTLPALTNHSCKGQLRLDRITPETIGMAVRTLLVDETARTLWGEAASLTMPGWADFAQAVADWTQR